MSGRRVAFALAAIALLAPIAPITPIARLIAQGSPTAPPNPIAPPAIPMPAIPAPPKPPTISPPSSPAVSGEPAGGSAGGSVGKSAASSSPSKQVTGRAASETAGFLSLLGFGDDNPLLPGISGADVTGAKNNTNALLERLIEKMDAGGSSGAGAKASATAPKAPAAGTTRSADKARPVAEAGVEVLRCVVNGHDLERGFAGSFVSTRAGDGSFLVTGERYLVLEGVRRREFVYLLYRPTTGSSGSLYVDVSQEVPNEESFFRRLSLSGPLSASAIGDLVVCRASREDLIADFLFRSRPASVRPTPGR